MRVDDAIGEAVDLPTPAWPAATLAEIQDLLCAPGALYEMEDVSVGGRTIRGWKNQPPSLPALARLARTAHRERLFMVLEEERVTFGAWFRATAALAAEMARLGVTKGDRVALAMRNLPEWPAVYFAATSLGAIITPLNAWWTADELVYGLQHCGAKLLVCDAERWARLRPRRAAAPMPEAVLVCRARDEDLIEAPARRLEALIGPTSTWADLPDADLPDVAIAPDDPATLFYTSGTTGRPKGALGSHRNVLTCVLSSAYVPERGARRRGEVPPPLGARVMLMVIPLFHVTACNAFLMGTLATGNTLVFMTRWDPTRALELIERERVNVTGGVPTIAWQLLEHPDRPRYDLSSLDSVVYGGAPAAPELARRLRADLGVQPGNGWGMTETSATVTNHVGEDYLHRPDSCGPPVPVADLKIMDPAGTKEMAVGEAGELWVRGPQVISGYWNDPEATAQTFVEGWLRTGDIARLDEDGFCYIVDRAKDIIIRGGENIYAAEVESVLYEHEAVMDAAVVGLPDRVLGEQPAAAVRLAPGKTVDEAGLIQWVSDRLARFKVPVRILFLPDMLPRNANGKVMKVAVRDMFDH